MVAQNAAKPLQAAEEYDLEDYRKGYQEDIDLAGAAANGEVSGIVHDHPNDDRHGLIPANRANTSRKGGPVSSGPKQSSTVLSATSTYIDDSPTRTQSTAVTPASLRRDADLKHEARDDGIDEEETSGNAVHGVPFDQQTVIKGVGGLGEGLSPEEENGDAEAATGQECDVDNKAGVVANGASDEDGGQGDSSDHQSPVDSQNGNEDDPSDNNNEGIGAGNTENTPLLTEAAQQTDPNADVDLEAQNGSPNIAARFAFPSIFITITGLILKAWEVHLWISLLAIMVATGFVVMMYAIIKVVNHYTSVVRAR